MSSTPGNTDGPRPAAARSRSRKLGHGPTRAAALVVVDSMMIGRIIARSIAKLAGYEVEVACSREQAVTLLERGGWTAAVVDLELADSAPGEVVDVAIAAGVPTIVLTGSYDEETRSAILQRPVVDYFVKGDGSFTALNDALDRLRINPAVKILVVDDSTAFRLLSKRLLEIHRFDVLEAVDGSDALTVVDANPDVTLVITDYEMPHMNGVELVGNLRQRRGRAELAIIGVSALGDRALPARYLKHGADDFLTKPFEKEEFYCRVYRSVTNVEQIRRITRAAYTDQLTQLSNRLHFFSNAPAALADARAANTPFAVAMVDIDFFKKINDTYGHAGGDVALQHLARILTEELDGADMVARFGGEEFCITARGASQAELAAMFEGLRARVEAAAIEFEGQVIKFTLSIGVAVETSAQIDDMINRADQCLYQAKESGRNRVIFAAVADPSGEQ